MKERIKKLVLWLLKVMAKRRLKTFRGKVVAVTGSVGKTSTKEAIYTVLNTQFKVKQTKKSMNSDFGLLLTILDIESGFSSATKWSWFLIKGFVHSFMRDHSEVLLLEMGVDKPGDMDFLLSVVKPDIAVVTGIAHVHMDEGQFRDLHHIFEEKSKLVHALKEGGIAVLNTDDEILASFVKKIGGKKVVSFGQERDHAHAEGGQSTDFWASQIKQSLEGIDFILHHDNKRYDVHLNVLGKYQTYVVLPGIICGVLLGMPIENAIFAALKYTLPPGRMSVIPGMEGSVILDSSYNSSPKALKEALKILADVGNEKRKIAVLGNMNELGSHSAKMHEEIGAMVPDMADMLLTVGTDAQKIAEKAIEKGMSEKAVFSFKNALEAAEFFKEKVKKGDIILVKGSQNNVRLERFVKMLMENPDDAKDLLVRQERIWQVKL